MFSASNTFGSEVATDRWSVELLQAMDWKRFEDLCFEVLRRAGFDGVTTEPVMTGGEFELVAQSAGMKRSRHDVAVRCRRWTMPVGVQAVRTFLSAVRRRGMPRAIFITAGSFARRVRIEFVEEPELALVDGRELIEGIQDLGEEEAARLLAEWVDEDGQWRVPTCPVCDVKMERDEETEAESAGAAGPGAGYACPNRRRPFDPCGTRFSPHGFPVEDRADAAPAGPGEPRRRFALRHLRESEGLVLPS